MPESAMTSDVHAVPKMAVQELYIQLTCWYAPSYGFGGPIRLMADYAQWAIDSGAIVKVLTGDIHHDYTRLPANVPHALDRVIRRFPVWGTALAKKAIFLLSPRYFLEAFMLTLKHPGRVYLHLFDFRGLVPIAAIVLKTLFPRKVVIIHSAFGTLHPKPSRIRVLYDRFFLKAQIRALDLAFVQNEHEMRVYISLIQKYESNAKVSLLPLHYDAAAKQEAGLHSKKLRAQYDLAPEAVVLLFLGRFHPQKGLMRTVDLLRCVRARGIDATLFLVGRDHGFQREIESYVSSCGMTPYVRIVTDVFEQRFSYYTLADVFIGVPTIYEETMLAAVEALSCGTPVLLSKESDMPYVAEKNAGYTIDFDLGTATDRLLSIISNRATFSVNAFDVATTYYSPNSIRSQFSGALRRKF